MAVNDAVRFVLDGEIVAISDLPPTTTVLEFLRDVAGRTGTKEGCAEGDCGACTVVLGELCEDGQSVRYNAVNSCIRFLPTIDGKELITVESLRASDGELHPVQKSMVEHHASQCGFCTPGFVMSLFALYLNGERATREGVLGAVSGNLCRCTGYRPIIDAGCHMSDYDVPSRWSPAEARSASHVAALRSVGRTADDGSLRLNGFYAPRTVEELAAELEASPDSMVLAGGTDVGLWVTKQLRDLPPIVYIGAIPSLQQIRRSASGLHIGAAVSLTAAWDALVTEFPALAEQAKRFASVPVCNSGTLGGNVANGSPIGDSMPALIALGAEIELRRGSRVRRLPLDKFYLGYQKKDLQPGEFVTEILVPPAVPGRLFASYKLAKRTEQDISAVCGAFAVDVLDGRVVAAAKFAYGGMAPTPARALRAEAAVVGKQWSESVVADAVEALAADFQPLTDARASAAYRLEAAGSMLRRFYLANAGRLASGVVDAPVASGVSAAPTGANGSGLPGESQPHDSAHLHVTGRAQYCDDIPLPANALHAAFGISAVAHGRIQTLDLGPVTATPGVVTIARVADIPGENNYGGAVHDDPIFTDSLVQYVGQPIFAVAATSYSAARRAARRARITYDELPAILDIRAALAAQSYVLPSRKLVRGSPSTVLVQSPRRLQGTVTVGGQDHFYLEGQVAVAIPQDDGAMLVHSSTQHPTEVQHVVAHALGVGVHSVVVQCRRMGGGFGGKESQPALIAATAAILARKTGRAVKLRLDRDQDMIMTGKRHDFIADYDVGFDAQGRILALTIMLASRCGYSADLSGPVNDRAVYHLDNAYFLEHVEVVSHRCKTHTVSNTAFRGFGGPQGMMVIEQIIDSVARTLGKDPVDVRRVNFYGTTDRNVTHYGQTVEDNVIHDIFSRLEGDSCYRERRKALSEWNAGSPIVKRGLAMTPVKFGISFTATSYNQAGALVHAYTDGTVLVNHGGTEMGQGLHIKVVQVVAAELGLPLNAVRITTTDTSKVPNTSATAASSGSDLNGKAAQAAARTIRERLVEFACDSRGVSADEVRFDAGHVHIGTRSVTFGELVREAHTARISLSATGYYRTPDIYCDRATMLGRPFFYFAYGAAVAEVAIDTLTGETRLLRVDILHDVGTSLNPAIDMGQIEGGFLQGVGWLTSEELWWNEKGELRTYAPSTYKIPTARDWAMDTTVRLLEHAPNKKDTIYRSKAVGEPPLMLAMAVFQAIGDACAACGSPGALPRLSAPATPEAVLRAVNRVRAAAGTA